MDNLRRWRLNAVVERFTHACQADQRVLAAFLGGSLASDTADDWSDLDLYIVAEDEEYEAFFRDRQAFVRQFGDPVWLEDFNGFGFDMVLFVLADGVDGELAFGRATDFQRIHAGPFQTLLDRRGLLTKRVFPFFTPDVTEQKAELRRLIGWFWREISLYARARARRRRWDAFSHLEQTRVRCVNIVRAQSQYMASLEGYEKVEQVVSSSLLSPLEATFVPLELSAMDEAVERLAQFFREVAPLVAARWNIPSPSELERVALRQLEESAHITAATRDDQEDIE
jgi:predicted nucleotidyltransferase